MKWKCNRCTACCKISPWISRKRIANIKKLGYNDFTEQSPDGLFFLKMKNNQCIFLNQKTCKIYKARPTTCRLYPSKLRADGDCRPETLQSDRLFK